MNDMVSATCTANKGDLPLEIYWTTAPGPDWGLGKLMTNDGILITKNTARINMLSIESVQGRHRANYTCVAKNIAGVAFHTTELSVKVLPQIVPFDFGEEDINELDMVSASCTVNKGDLPINVVWTKNGIRLYTSDGIVITRTSQRMSVISIESVRARHTGNYSCIASNSAGTTNYSAALFINVLPQIVPFDFGEESINEMDMVSASCTVNKGDLPIDIIWMKNEGRVYSNDGLIVTRNSQRLSVLSIESVRARHTGNYTCIASNRAGQTNHSALLAVNVLPQILPFDFGEEIINEHDMVSAYCTVNKGDLPLDIVWTKNGNRLYTNDGVVITRNSQRISVLSIESVRARHAGNYTCVASNKAGSMLHSALLTVKVLPQILPFDFGDPVNANDMATINCAVTKGDLPVDIYWRFNGFRLFGSNDGIVLLRSGQRISMLNIEAVRPRHMGTYECVVSNVAGTVEHSSKLRVNVPPVISPFTFGEDPINTGENAGVQCMVQKGDIPVDIRWMLNDKSIINGQQGVTIINLSPKTSVLNIAFVEEYHRGVFQCIAENGAGTYVYSSELKVNVPPQIMPFVIGDEAMNFGDMAGAQCMVSKGDLPINIQWTLNGNVIVNGNDGFSLLRTNMRTSSLSIHALEAKHRGVYKCIATNRAGSTEFSAELHVNVPPHILPFNFGNEVLNMGDVLSITCNVPKGDLPLDILWSLNMEPITSGVDGFQVLRLNPRTSYLSVDSLAAKHRGSYRCIAVNLAGLAEYAAELQVNVAPQISAFAFGEEPLNRGEVASVTCVVPKGDLPLDISWTLNSVKIVSGKDGFNVFKMNKRTSSLNIDTLEALHRGTYKCIAENNAGRAEHLAVLEVNVPPQVMPFAFGDEPSNYGDSTAVNCMVFKGDTPLQLHWTLNDEEITNDIAGIRIIRMSPKLSSLSIDSINGLHRGIFKCIATNAAGSNEQTAELIVNVPPQVQPFSFGEEASNFGDSVGVQCVTQGDLPMNIMWTLNNHTLNGGDYDIIIGRMGAKSSTLNIDFLTAAHRGVYACIVSNHAGQNVAYAELKINVLPLIHPFGFDGEANEGDSVQLTCHVSKGDLPLKIHWVHNDLPVYSNLGVISNKIGDRLSVLSIAAVRAVHMGNYSCIAQNKAGESIYTAAMFVNVLPQIIPFSYEDNINIGDSVDLLCQIKKGDRPIKINWSFERSATDTRYDTIQPVMRTNRVNSKSNILSIPEAMPAHTGTYTCTATNSAGSSKYSTNLLVNVPPRITPFQFGEEPLNFGEPASIQCTLAGGDWPMSVEWLFNNYHMPSHLNIATTKFTRHTHVLAIESVTGEHAGNYTCVARNWAGEAAFTATLIVNVPPKITPFTFGDEPLNFGEPVSVHCTVSGGDLPILVTWTLNNEPLHPELEILTEKHGKRIHNLMIDAIEAKHAGNYTCIASNLAGTIEHSAELIVNAPPKINPFSFGDESMSYGEFVNVQCTVTGGDLPVHIIWTLNNKPFDDYLHIMTSKRSKRVNELTIESVTAQHAGNYTCIAENEAGRVNHTAELRVNG